MCRTLVAPPFQLRTVTTKQSRHNGLRGVSGWSTTTKLPLPEPLLPENIETGRYRFRAIKLERHITLPYLHTDLFSHYASPLEVYVFVAVDEKGEDVMSDEICHRCIGKQQRKGRGGRNLQLPGWVMNKTKRQHIIALTWVTKIRSFS